MSIYEIAEQMAEAIREWNRAKQERESWKPVPGQTPPVGILGSAKTANAMLTQALEEYESFRQHENLTGGAGELLKQHESDTRQLAQLLVERQKLASMVNSLANTVLDSKNASDNDRFEAEEAIKRVLPLL